MPAFQLANFLGQGSESVCQEVYVFDGERLIKIISEQQVTVLSLTWKFVTQKIPGCGLVAEP